MRRSQFFALMALSIALISACVSTGKSPSTCAVDGSWYGKTTESDGSRVEWLTKRTKEGTYTVYFKYPVSGRKVIEAGHWSCSNGLYTTVTEVIDNQTLPLEGRFTDTYEVVLLDQNNFHYKHAKADHYFKSVRVSETFNLFDLPI